MTEQQAAGNTASWRVTVQTLEYSIMRKRRKKCPGPRTNLKCKLKPAESEETNSKERGSSQQCLLPEMGVTAWDKLFEPVVPE